MVFGGGKAASRLHPWPCSCVRTSWPPGGNQGQQPTVRGPVPSLGSVPCSAPPRPGLHAESILLGHLARVPGVCFLGQASVRFRLHSKARRRRKMFAARASGKRSVPEILQNKSVSSLLPPLPAPIPCLGSRGPASTWGAPSPLGQVVFCLHSNLPFEHLRSLFP